MPLSTNGFESLEQLRSHFRKHGSDFGASNRDEYEEMADSFLSGEKPEAVYECVNACGAILRYDPSSEAFGVLDEQSIIRTYFKPIPCAQVPFHERDAERQAGRCHSARNNLSYFQSECRK
jgi:pyocin large subunit-like protein